MDKTSKIITFYSFKGGVGRTMALANVALLAARNNKRVLIMDWDLEAPGLAYYFRGLTDGAWMRKLRGSPGVLNVLWEWVNRASQVNDEENAKEVFSDFMQGKSFANCVSPIVEPAFIGPQGCLDYIGAGSPLISTPEPTPYEDALANFSWRSFFEDTAGGVVIQGLREWAKKNYDLIFIDSRTGLADVSGICTMQIPDTVALCFILNRQNIDGVARVSGAIKKRRGDAIAVRAVPMRTARQETSEEADARARAITELTKIGGFSSDAITADMRHLSINAADNVPFYETLSLFAVPEAAYDPLTLQYLRLATEITGEAIQNLPLDDEQYELVRMRLQPTHATPEYVTKLKTAEPSRALSEIRRLLISALNNHLDDGLTDETYVESLTDAAFHISETEDQGGALELHEKVLGLLRELSQSDPSRWRNMFADALEKYILLDSIWIDDNEQLALLKELDFCLAKIPDPTKKIKRVEYLTKTAWLLFSADNLIDARLSLDAAFSLLSDLDIELKGAEENYAPADLIANLKILEGSIHAKNNNRDSAVRSYEEGLQLVRQNKPEVVGGQHTLKDTELNLIVRLATTKSTITTPIDRANYALQAIEANGSRFVHFNFLALIDAIVDSDENDLAERFFFTFFPKLDRKSMAFLASLHGSLRMVAPLLNKLAEVISRVAMNKRSIFSEKMLPSCVQAASLATMALNQSARRKRETHKGTVSIATAAARLQSSFAALDFPWDMPTLSIDGNIDGSAQENS